MLVAHPAFHLFLYILPRDPQNQFSSNKWGTVPSLVSYSTFPFPCTLECLKTQTIPQNVRWKYHSMPLGTVVPMGTSLWQSEGLSKPPVRANTNIYLWSFIYMNFICTGQDSVCTSVLVLTSTPYW